MARIMSALILSLLLTSAVAADRSRLVRAEFQRLNPCPVNGATRGACPGWEVDHGIVLCSGGKDEAVVIDLFSRQVVGWSLREDMTRDNVIDALRMAWFKRRPSKRAGLMLARERFDFLLALVERGLDRAEIAAEHIVGERDLVLITPADRGEHAQHRSRSAAQGARSIALDALRIAKTIGGFLHHFDRYIERHKNLVVRRPRVLFARSREFVLGMVLSLHGSGPIPALGRFAANPPCRTIGGVV